MNYPISIVPCPCGHEGCSDYHLVGVGKFCQGSGFSKAEAGYISDILNHHRPNGISIEEATKGRRVMYVPDRANGDPTHPSCENGCIKRMASPISDNDMPAAFVLYDNLDTLMVTGDEPYTAKCTRLENLTLIQN